MTDLPWPQINECLLESAAARQPKEMLQLALTGIGRFIPFDINGILGVIDQTGQIVSRETYGAPDYWIQAYRQHYYRLLIPSMQTRVPLSAAMDWTDYRHTEWVTDFMGPQYVRYTAAILNPGGISFSINRSAELPPFSAVELKTLAIVAEHLSNYWRMLNFSDQDHPYPDAADLLSLNPQLTRREAEIAALLCRKYSAEIIASRLLISPLTVYKHIENIYLKMNVNCRKDLRAKLLEPDQ